MPDRARSWLPLTGGELCAAVDPYGAQLSLLQDADGRDLLWNGDPQLWAGRAPLLFPIVGVLAGGRYRLGSESYALSRHGFARDRLFSVESSDAASASLRLRADDSTLQIYPFQFQLDLHYACLGATFSVRASIRNLGSTDMPASFGYHPGFLWPLPYGEARAAHFIEFESDEPAAVRRIDGAGLLRAEHVATPIANRRLPLADALFQEDVLILDQVRSRSVTYGGSRGPRIRVSFPDTPYLGFWSKPGAPFVCIEPWHGVTDPQGFSGDFTEKPGVVLVRPGAALDARMDITLLRPPA
ncbi:MAG TPA: aldose 1-epimerase family protein [Steroidobacteraceae bacterium]|jgi:galactose mutarotase-like enzyme|nr:aldose 1-epimerase family protein [Steroidobacteraceae bacterium]